MISIHVGEAIKTLRAAGKIVSVENNGLAVSSNVRAGQFSRNVLIPYSDSLGSLVNKNTIKLEAIR